MLGEKRIKEITERVLGMSEADATEVSVMGIDSALTRFANNYVHQNVIETNALVSVRVVLGKRIGVAQTNDLTDEGLSSALESAQTLARFQRENEDFRSLPTLKDAGTPRPVPYIEATAGATPDMRADGAGIICKLAREEGLTAAGAFSTEAQEMGVSNSLGLFNYGRGTAANLITVVMGETSSGYANRAALDVGEIDAEAVAREAVGKAVRGKDPVSVDPGTYTVVLEEYAMGGLLEYLALSGGFSATSVQEGRSFLAKGEQITGGNITIFDDGADPRGLALGIDPEGVAKRRVDLIKGGIAGDPVYDSYTAGKEGKSSTGHALPPPNPYGPLPLNLFLEPGTTPKEKLAEGIERGIWVTRFHYMGVVHPFKAIITGMTRDGTFLIENGEVTRPIKNLRFNQPVLEGWRDAVLSDTPKLQKGFLFGSASAPAARIDRFIFGSGTSF
jgi:PmbA protein